MSIRFCQKCGNMLTPTENIKDRTLIYKCDNENCEFREGEKLEKGSKPSKETNLVYRNEIKLGQTEVKINNSIINDPTYARSFKEKCPKCDYNEAICFQNPNINDAGMKFMYVCCNKNFNNTNEPCGHHWFKEKDDDKDKQQVKN